MLKEPDPCRAAAFFDGQNLFHGVRACFGHTYPNYDVQALARRICNSRSWQLAQVRLYTGVPDRTDGAFWHNFWAKKLLAMGRSGVVVYSRPLRYRDKTVRIADGSTHVVRTGEEKGIDIRIAIDIIRLAHRGEYDVALVFSQDQDLSEVADEIRVIACAYPHGPNSRNSRGINGTDWIRFDQDVYDGCLDPRDYRARQGGP